jgi:hypothetical protein
MNRMNQPSLGLLSAAAALLAACASPAYLRHEKLAFVGRIESRVELPNKSVLVKTTVIGTYVSPTYTSGKSDFVYTVVVEKASEKKVRVSSRAELKNGMCVDVMVHEIREGVDSFTPSDATLVESSKCKS